MEERYDAKKLILLSRVVHKIAFETLAWFLWRNNTMMINGIEVDLYADIFTPIRAWARFGQGKVRPFLRWPADSAMSAPGCSRVGGDLVFHGLIIGAGHAAAITGPSDQALPVLDTWVQEIVRHDSGALPVPKNVGNVMVVETDLTGLATRRGEKESVRTNTVRLQFAVLADHVAISDAGKLDVSGTFTEIYPQPLPFVVPRVFLGIGLRLMASTDGYRLYMDIELRNPTGAVSRVRGDCIDFGNAAFNSHSPNMHYLALPVDGLTLNGVGLHILKVSLLNVGSIEWPLYVRHG